MVGSSSNTTNDEYTRYTIQNLLMKDPTANTYVQAHQNKRRKELSTANLIELYHAVNRTRGAVSLAQLGKTIIKKLACAGKELLKDKIPLVRMLSPESISAELNEDDMTAILVYSKSHSSLFGGMLGDPRIQHPFMTVGKNMLCELFQTNIGMFTSKMQALILENKLPFDLEPEVDENADDENSEDIQDDDENMEDEATADVPMGDDDYDEEDHGDPTEHEGTAPPAAHASVRGADSAPPMSPTPAWTDDADDDDERASHCSHASSAPAAPFPFELRPNTPEPERVQVMEPTYAEQLNQLARRADEQQQVLVPDPIDERLTDEELNTDQIVPGTEEVERLLRKMKQRR